MPPQMVLREVHQFLRRRRAFNGKDLGEDMAAELLDPYFIEPSFRVF
jgi:hypothetical protein